MAETRPLVVVMMGSKSDWEVMRHADEELTKFGVAHECRVLSAHRTPKETAEYVSGAEARGVEAIIAAAGIRKRPNTIARPTKLSIFGRPANNAIAAPIAAMVVPAVNLIAVA